jgi:uncharacterized damage-inducible protein DinB
MKGDGSLREHLVKLLDWEDAHAGFEKTVANIPAKDRGRQPAGLPYSPWQILEHLRRTQHDILDFCVNPKYEERAWPDDYWPSAAAPESEKAWEDSISQFKKDRKALQKLAADPKIDLFARIPHGSGQTYLRELLLVADHTAHHLGELIVLRRLLGNWK